MANHNRTQKQVNMDTALELRLAGMSYRQIAAKMEVSSTTAFGYVKDAISIIQKSYTEKAHELVTIDLNKLSKMEMALYQKAMGGDKGAIDGLLKIMERRAKLLGLDAPVRSKIAHELPAPITFVLPGCSNKDKDKE